MSVLRKDLILVDMDCASAEEAIRRLAETFVASGLVKPSFPQAVIDREKEYPTGLPAKGVDIALPHTVADHVLQPAMGVGVLKKQVVFQQMGSPEITLHPRVIIMLAFTDPKDQIGTLKKIMKLLQDESLLTGVRDAASPDAILELLQPALA